MKKALLPFYTLTFFILIISSCGKKTDNGVYIPPGSNGNGVSPGNGNGTSNGGTITATISGTLFSSTSVTYETNGALSGFAAVEGTSSEIVLTINNDSVGVHPINAILTDVLYTANTGANYSSNYGNFPGLGSVVITSNTAGTISGTFSCSLYNMTNTADSVKLTNGVFTSLAF